MVIARTIDSVHLYSSTAFMLVVLFLLPPKTLTGTAGKNVPETNTGALFTFTEANSEYSRPLDILYRVQ
jgi:hypothetical protein